MSRAIEPLKWHVAPSYVQPLRTELLAFQAHTRNHHDTHKKSRIPAKIETSSLCLPISTNSATFPPSTGNYIMIQL